MSDVSDWYRRDVLSRFAALGGAGLLASCSPKEDGAEPAMETTSIRLIRDPEFAVLCYAPQYLAEVDFLREEGFTDVQYVSKIDGSEAQALVSGTADMSSALAVDWIIPISNGIPVVVLGGLHPGCVEIFVNDTITTMRDLKGKRIGVSGMQSPERFLLASIVSYIGLDPNVDVEWVFAHPLMWGKMLVDGEVDALAAFPPMNQGLHKAGVGRVILNTTTDDPWQNYFCCMIAANQDYVKKNPVATKRALRAILRANRLASRQPEVASKRLVEQGVAPDVETAQTALNRIPYDAWRNYDPVDSMRFYSLRLREAGLITQTPEEILKRGTDWRFFNELKEEMAV